MPKKATPKDSKENKKNSKEVEKDDNLLDLETSSDVDEESNQDSEGVEEIEDSEEVDDEDTNEEDDEDNSEEDLDESFKVSKDDYAILNALKSSSTRTSLIRQLAEEAGLQVSSGENKNSVKRAWVEQLRKTFGDKIADGLIPVFESALDEAVKPLRQEMANSEINRIKNEVNRATARFFANNKEARPFERKMMVLAEKYPSNPDVDIEEYLGDLFELAKIKSGKKVTNAEEERNNRINRNKKVVNLRNADRVPGGKIKQGTGKNLTLDEAINAGIRGERLV